MKRVPKGTSEYQAAWITNSDDEEGDENEDDEFYEEMAEASDSDNSMVRNAVRTLAVYSTIYLCNCLFLPFIFMFSMYLFFIFVFLCFFFVFFCRTTTMNNMKL